MSYSVNFGHEDTEEVKWVALYSEANKPSMHDITGMNVVYHYDPNDGLPPDVYNKVAVFKTIPQASSIEIEFTGGSGFNAGNHAQPTKTTFIIRGGNDRPIGVTVNGYQIGASPTVSDAYLQYNKDGTCSFWVKAASAVTHGSILKISSPVEIIEYSSIGLGEIKTKLDDPSTVFTANIYTQYTTQEKPTPNEIGALAYDATSVATQKLKIGGNREKQPLNCDRTSLSFDMSELGFITSNKAGYGFADVIYLNSYLDTSAGYTNAIAFSKKDQNVYLVNAKFGSNQWNEPVALYSEFNKPTKDDVGKLQSVV